MTTARLIMRRSLRWMVHPSSFTISSTADHATLIVGRSGFLEFVDTSNGAQATVINNAGGEVRIADLTTGGTSLGSIAGAGTFNLGSKQLTVGSLNTSTTVSGIIEDRFPGTSYRRRRLAGQGRHGNADANGRQPLYRRHDRQRRRIGGWRFRQPYRRSVGGRTDFSGARRNARWLRQRHWRRNQ